MIDERELIKTLLQWKENGNKFAGLIETIFRRTKNEEL